MKNLDEYTTLDLVELEENIDFLMEQAKPRGKKEKLQAISNITDRMRLFHKLSGTSKIYNLNYGK